MSVGERERQEIRRFVESQAPYFAGNVLDFGCGAQPYRDIVEKAGAHYYGWDHPFFPDYQKSEEPIGFSESPLGILDLQWDVILCTQVISLVPDVLVTLKQMHRVLVKGGRLIMTYGYAYRPFHELDRWHFTQAGMDDLLRRAGFTPLFHRPTWHFEIESGYQTPVGYGVVALAH